MFILTVLAVATGCAPGLVKPPPPPPPPQRIVSLSPGITEMLFALGAGDRVVGVSAFCNFPEGAKTKTNVGGPDPLKLSTEDIVSLKPDLILADLGYQQRAVDSLTALGLPLKALPASSVLDIVYSMQYLSNNVGMSEEGKRTLLQIERDIHKLTFPRFEYPNPPKVFYLVNEQPLITAGPGSFTHEIVLRAGGRNVFDNVRGQYPTVSEEELIRRNPDVIVLVRPANPEAKRAELLAKPAWQMLTAVKQKRIIFVDEDRGSRPGPRIFDAIRELEAALHPKPNP